ncbi:hypothetical protein F4818DRAFT_320356 [Hypoxylon cercidicola]|nr:hypothetical protein F4818DRAFT_320356 [Hypoxylon cercidicola]
MSGLRYFGCSALLLAVTRLFLLLVARLAEPERQGTMGSGAAACRLLRPILKRRRPSQQDGTATATAPAKARRLEAGGVAFSDVAVDIETGERVAPSGRPRDDFVREAERRRAARLLDVFRSREEAFQLLKAEIEIEIEADVSDEGESDDDDGGRSSSNDDDEEEEEEVEVEVEWSGNVKSDGRGNAQGEIDADVGRVDEFEIVFEAEGTSDEEGGADDEGSADDEWDDDDDDEYEDEEDEDEVEEEVVEDIVEDMDIDSDSDGGCKLR